MNETIQPTRLVVQRDDDRQARSDALDVGLVSPGFPPQLGGVETVVGHLAETLSARGHQVTVYTHRLRGGTAGEDASESQRYSVNRFTDWTGLRQFPVAPGMWHGLRQAGSVHDIVHAHNFHSSPALAATFASSAPLIFSPHFHGVGHTGTARAVHKVYDWVATYIFDRAQAVVCVSEAETQAISRMYPLAADKTVIVPNAVDIDAILKAEPFTPERPVVLVAGRLERYKQVSTVIRAMPKVPDAQLVVIGGGPEADSLESLARELNISDRASFLGPVSDSVLRRWQRTAHVTVSLSHHEAYGLICAEATVAGSRVVASDIPAHRERARAHGNRFSLVPPSASPATVARAIRDACSGNRLGSSRAGICTWEDTTAQMLDVYRRCA